MSSSSQVASYVALIAASLSIGYWAGVGSTLPITRSSSDAPDHPGSTPANELDSESNDSEHERLSNVTTGVFEECKLVLVVRSDLKMSSGKIAAQCSHATLACFKTIQVSNPKLLRSWERQGQTKVALRCGSEDELQMLEATARSMNICARSIQDAGRTQIAAGSRTVLGIGPAPARLINQITGKLKLL